MALDPPPDDPAALARFPARRPPVGPGRPLHRVFRHRDAATGRARRPFFFASAPAAGSGGRYDPLVPLGACYLAPQKAAAFLEVFRMLVVPLEDLRARRLCTTEAPRSVPTADLLAARARSFGVTAEIHTTADRHLTQAWAQRLYETGFRALWGQARHDPTLRQRIVALLDRAGEHQPFGWRWRTEIGRLESDAELATALRRFGYRIVEIPWDVAIHPD